MLSREFLIERGYCCGHGCLMCPYEPPHQEGNTNYWDCNPSGDCWCKKMPNVVPISGSECMSPTKLKKLIKEENEKT
tara:strand:+ start:1473 stop:1703 length:231 start_codon:yes stop_codon:yes gene_type:complete